MSKKATPIIIVLSVFILLAAMMVVVSSPRGELAQAADDTLTLSQSGNVVYNGKSFITLQGGLVNFGTAPSFDNPIHSAVSAKLGTSSITLSTDAITVKSHTEIRMPKLYYLSVDVTVGGTTYREIPLQLTVSKKVLDVKVKLDGMPSLTVTEGVLYRSSVEYAGFVGTDDVDTLDAPAVVEIEPKMPIKNYAIYASLAMSDYYEFNYIPAILTIVANPIEIMRFNDKEINYLTLTGAYSPYSELNYIDVGVEGASSLYAEIKSKMDRHYASTRIFDDYKPIAAYRINLLVDNVPLENARSEVLIKTNEQTKGKKNYLVIHFANDGSNDVLNATETENGYISFSTSDLGDFVILSEITGMNTTQALLVAVCIIGGVILILLLFTVFRRKY